MLHPTAPWMDLTWHANFLLFRWTDAIPAFDLRATVRVCLAGLRLLQNSSSSGSFSGATSLMELESFWKTFCKTASSIDVYSRSRLEPRFIAPPLKWTPEGAPIAAPCLEVLQNELFGRDPAGETLRNRSLLFFVFWTEILTSSITNP